MKFQGTYLIIFAFALAAYYMYLGVRILREKAFIQNSAITDYIIVAILIPLFINTIAAFIRNRLYLDRNFWIFFVIIFLVTAFYSASAVIGLTMKEIDIYNKDEEEVKEKLEAAAKKMNIKCSVKDPKYILSMDDSGEKTAGIEIISCRVPQFVKVTAENLKNIDNYQEFFKEFKASLLSEGEAKKPDKKSYVFYLAGAAALIVAGATAIVINLQHLWV